MRLLHTAKSIERNEEQGGENDARTKIWNIFAHLPTDFVALSMSCEWPVCARTPWSSQVPKVGQISEIDLGENTHMCQDICSQIENW